MDRLPVLRMSRALFGLNAAIWAALAAASLARGGDFAWMLFNCAAMLFGGWGIGQGKRGLYWLAVALVAANIVLAVTGELGPLDLATLVIDVILLGLLVGGRRGFMERPE